MRFLLHERSLAAKKFMLRHLDHDSFEREAYVTQGCCRKRCDCCHGDYHPLHGDHSSSDSDSPPRVYKKQNLKNYDQDRTRAPNSFRKEHLRPFLQNAKDSGRTKGMKYSSPSDQQENSLRADIKYLMNKFNQIMDKSKDKSNIMRDITSLQKDMASNSGGHRHFEDESLELSNRYERQGSHSGSLRGVATSNQKNDQNFAQQEILNLNRTGSFCRLNQQKPNLEQDQNNNPRFMAAYQAEEMPNDSNYMQGTNFNFIAQCISTKKANHYNPDFSGKQKPRHSEKTEKHNDTLSPNDKDIFSFKNRGSTVHRKSDDDFEPLSSFFKTKSPQLSNFSSDRQYETFKRTFNLQLKNVFSYSYKPPNSILSPVAMNSLNSEDKLPSLNSQKSNSGSVNSLKNSHPFYNSREKNSGTKSIPFSKENLSLKLSAMDFPNLEFSGNVNKPPSRRTFLKQTNPFLAEGIENEVDNFKMPDALTPNAFLSSFEGLPGSEHKTHNSLLPQYNSGKNYFSNDSPNNENEYGDISHSNYGSVTGKDNSNNPLKRFSHYRYQSETMNQLSKANPMILSNSKESSRNPSVTEMQRTYFIQPPTKQAETSQADMLRETNPNFGKRPKNNFNSGLGKTTIFNHQVPEFSEIPKENVNGKFEFAEEKSEAIRQKNTKKGQPSFRKGNSNWEEDSDESQERRRKSEQIKKIDFYVPKPEKPKGGYLSRSRTTFSHVTQFDIDQTTRLKKTGKQSATTFQFL